MPRSQTSKKNLPKALSSFLKVKEAARLANKKSFKYTNKDNKTKTYYRNVTKTGMVVYSAKRPSK